MSELLLHYVWRHRLFHQEGLFTTDGESIEVIDSGMHNDDQGPDFLNAKVRIGSELWVGSIEIHNKASQWFAHGHDSDEGYNNVVLHVVGENDAKAVKQNGMVMPQLLLSIPSEILKGYQDLLTNDKYPPCRKALEEMPGIIITSWLSRLATERLQQRTDDIMERLQLCNGSWEQVCFITMARAFGFGVNSDAFEAWAKSFPLTIIDHHRDHPDQIEALFYGQAGLLFSGENDDYQSSLAKEYAYLQKKFSLEPISTLLWRFLRMRPQNFPTIRISQLCQLYVKEHALMSKLSSINSIDELDELINVGVSDYWLSHYTFGKASKKVSKRLSRTSLHLIALNAVVPLIFAYGRYRNDEKMVQRAMTLLESLPAEDNTIVRMWQQCGLPADSASTSQALIQLKKRYCDHHDCLRCRFGYYYLKGRNVR